MPVLLLTTLLVCVAIEALNTFMGQPSGLGIGQDAGALSWILARATLKGCLAGSAEIAIFRFVLLHETEDRPVWRCPGRYDRYIAYGLGLGCALALLIGLARYAGTGWLILGSALLALAFLSRSTALCRAIVAETYVLSRDLIPLVSRLICVFLCQIAVGCAAGTAMDLLGWLLHGMGVPPVPMLANHAGPVLQSLTGPYIFAASFCVLYRAMRREAGSDAGIPAWSGVSAPA